MIINGLLHWDCLWVTKKQFLTRNRYSHGPAAGWASYVPNTRQALRLGAQGIGETCFYRGEGREYWLMTTGDYTTYTYKSIYIYTPAITSTSTYFYFYFFLVQGAVLATGCYQRAKIFTADRGRPSFAGGNCGEQISLYVDIGYIGMIEGYYWDILGIIGNLGDIIVCGNSMPSTGME